jgi:hypothetical protein
MRSIVNSIRMETFVSRGVTAKCARKPNQVSACHRVRERLAVGCAEGACAGAGCNRFLSGWSGNSCMRYASGGFCMAGVGGSCLNASDVVTMSASARAAACSARPAVADATCGSSGCARFASSTCNPDIETSVGSVSSCTALQTTRQRIVLHRKRATSKGYCVAKSICDDVDRISDCSLVTHPGTNQSCNVGAGRLHDTARLTNEPCGARRIWLRCAYDVSVL